MYTCMHACMYVYRYVRVHMYNMCVGPNTSKSEAGNSARCAWMGVFGWKGQFVDIGGIYY